MTTQTVNIDAYAYVGTLAAKLRDPDDLSDIVATASSVAASGDVASRMVCSFSPTLIPAGDYYLEFIVNGTSYNQYVTLTGVDGEVALARNERSSGGTDEILAAINTYIDGALATVNGTVATIVGFPSSLVTGDSYTSDGGNSITVFIRDSNDDPITSVGSHEFTDPDFECDLIITSSGNAGRVRATVTYVDPGSGESYLRVEIPLSESRRAAPGTATMQCVLKWDGCQKTIATQTVTWVPRI